MAPPGCLGGGRKGVERSTGGAGGGKHPNRERCVCEECCGGPVRMQGAFLRCPVGVQVLRR